MDCPIRSECLAAALERQEPWGVWGGEIIERGTVIARKRPRGRPRKNAEVARATSTDGNNPAAA
jgi:WhiB family redox-sensing transcriptional regulator